MVNVGVSVESEMITVRVKMIKYGKKRDLTRSITNNSDNYDERYIKIKMIIYLQGKL